MELIKLVAQRSRWSDIVYILLNVVYAASLAILVSPGVDLPYLAFVLVLLSKWRVIAVRPRFWFANVQANFVDFLVGISVVSLMILTASTAPFIPALLAVLFAVWLLIVKPHTAQNWILAQAGIAQFIALMALFSYAHAFELKPLLTDSTLPTVLIAWLIGYMAARHALSSFKGEEDRTFLSLIWGVVVAELAWLAHHWTIAYPLYTNAENTQFMIPHVAIFTTVLGLASIYWYRSLHAPEDKKAYADARSITIFAVVLGAMLFIFRYGLGDIAAL